jgi:hypothetical protein
MQMSSRRRSNHARAWDFWCSVAVDRVVFMNGFRRMRFDFASGRRVKSLQRQRRFDFQEILDAAARTRASICTVAE